MMCLTNIPDTESSESWCRNELEPPPRGMLVCGSAPAPANETFAAGEAVAGREEDEEEEEEEKDKGNRCCLSPASRLLAPVSVDSLVSSPSESEARP